MKKQLAFTNIGAGNYVDSDDVYALIRYKGEIARRLKMSTTKEKRFYNLTGGNGTRTLIVFSNGIVMSSCVTTGTLKARLNSSRIELIAGNRYLNDPNRDDGEINDKDEFLLEEEEEDGDEYDDDTDETEDGSAKSV